MSSHLTSHHPVACKSHLVACVDKDTMLTTTQGMHSAAKVSEATRPPSFPARSAAKAMSTRLHDSTTKNQGNTTHNPACEAFETCTYS
mmetsp:Transcript_46492/g.108331  ORF Transcript_46492/g.108331 Transcript_46492/m.108331 type:complete len:88 (+) Transcript_46492:41-304(+)